MADSRDVVTVADHVPVRNNIAAGGELAPIIPQSYDDVARFAGLIIKADIAPKSLDSQEKVAVALMMGLEVGMRPFQAIQSIAVINKVPSIWGDAALALVEASGLLEDFEETFIVEENKITARCTAKRKGRPTRIVAEFSTEDAKAANLLGKSGPWQTYPRRMLQMRARGFCLRNGFPDVLKGMRTVEEVRDIPNTREAAASEGDVTALLPDDVIDADVEEDPAPEAEAEVVDEDPGEQGQDDAGEKEPAVEQEEPDDMILDIQGLPNSQEAIDDWQRKATMALQAIGKKDRGRLEKIEAALKAKVQQAVEAEGKLAVSADRRQGGLLGDED